MSAYTDPATLPTFDCVTGCGRPVNHDGGCCEQCWQGYETEEIPPVRYSPLELADDRRAEARANRR